jgi:hypothetical protein
VLTISAEAAGEAGLVDALFDRRPALPPVPGTPLGAERMRWEQILPRVCGLWAYFSICWTTDELKSKGFSARTG